MKRTIRNIGCILVVAGLGQLAEAQDINVTNVTFSISERYFEAKRVGGDLNGERISIISMSVNIGEICLGNFSANNLTSADEIHINQTIQISDSKAPVTINVTFSHKEWHVGTGFNHPEHTDTRTFSLEPLAGSLTYPTRYFDQFTGLDEFPVFFTEVDWYFNYTLNLSPFQPIINVPGGKLCFERALALNLVPNNPKDFSYIATFVWQYGFESVQWSTKWEFQMIFLSNINYQLEIYYNNHSNEYYNLSLDNIKYNISVTEYSFLNQFYDYFYQTDYRYFLASEMLYGVHNQRDDYLEDEEERFLNDYFISAVLQVGDQFWYPPYEKTFVVNDWYPIGTSYASDGAIEFIPGSLEHISAEQMNRVQISAFASYNSVNSPRSLRNSIDINPRAPAFTLRSDPSCSGTATGKIILENISGVDPLNRYYYQVGDIGTEFYFSGSSEETTAVLPGDYTINLFYNAESGLEACPSSHSITVNANPELQYGIISTTNPTCFENNDGQISVEVTSHHLSYQYFILEKPDQIIPDKEKGIFTGLADGNYHVRFSDQCTTETSRLILITKPADVTFKALTPTDPTCLTSANGMISISGEGPGSIFDYQILNSSGTVEASASGVSGTWTGNGLKGGSYTARVRSSGCIWKDQGVQLTPVTPMSIEKVEIRETCYGKSTGQVILTGAGGKKPYTYFKDELSQDNATFPGLEAIKYRFKVLTGAAGCTDQVIQEINVPSLSEIGIQMRPVDIVCFGNADGKIGTEITGATSPYTLAWDKKKDDGSWGNMNRPVTEIDQLDKGEYRFRLVDANLCAASNTAEIREPELLKVESAIPTDVVCFGENGWIAISASGGVGSYAYTSYTSGGTSFSGTESTMAVPAGDYFIDVEDANHCKATFGDYIRDFVVKVKGPPAPLGITYDKTNFNGYNVTCNGSKTGSLTISSSGGYPGHIYSINGIEQPSNIFNNAGAGTYLISTRDSKGCTVTQSVQLTEPDPISIINPVIKPVNCFGQPQGEISVTPAGGIVGTYRFRLDGLEVLSPGVFTNLYARTYDVELSDANGCKTNTLQTVPSLNPPISIMMIPENVRCFGENNGILNTTVSGGAGGFVYSWEIDRGAGWQSLGLSSGNINGLSPAAYRIKATDSKNCSEYKSATITQPQQLVISNAVQKDVTCFGENGSINITASGGSSAYTYICKEKAGTIYESPGREVILPPGSFSVSVRDAKGCLSAFGNDITITAPPARLDFNPALSAYNGFNISCNGMSDGYMTVTATGGNGSGYSGYLYSVNQSPDNINNRFDNLVKGTYNIRVTDSRGCKVEKAVTLTEPQALTVNILHTNPVKCFGQSTGEISVEATGGIFNTYRYKIDGSNEVSSGVFGNLKAGPYRIDVTDINGCTNNIQASVTNKNPAIVTQLSTNPVRCYGESNGTIASLNSGGAGSFSYTWEKKAGNNWQAIAGVTSYATNLNSGLYRIRVRDADNCLKYDSIAVIEPPALEINNVQIKDAVCFNDEGSFIPEAKGGNGGFSFYTSVDNGTTYTAYNPGNLLQPSSYILKVKDSKGCELVPAPLYTITKPETALGFNYTLSQFGDFNISCHGNNDGSVKLLPYGGNSAGYSGYLYHNGTRTLNDNTIASLGAGSYQFSVTDGRGCRVTKTINLTQPSSSMTFGIAELKQPLCSGDSNGSVSLVADGGKLPYLFSVNEGSYSPLSQFPNLSSARYHFRVSDSNGCSEEIDTALTSIISEMLITGIVSDVKCFGENSGSIDVSVIGGAAPYSFKWDDNSTTSSLASVQKGSYSINITDAAGCKNKKTFDVREPDHPLELKATTTPACAELNDGLITALAHGGTPPYLFALNRRSGFSSEKTFTAYSGHHKVYVSDFNDCISEFSATVGVKNSKPNINFMLASSRYELDTLVIIDVSKPVPDKVKWEFPAGTIVIDSTSHRALIKYTNSGLYPVKMSGTFGSCTYSIDKLLNISPFDPLLRNEDSNHKGIKSLSISPNPNYGRFEVRLDLHTKQEIAVKIFDFQSRTVFNELWPPDINFRKEIDLPENVMPGNYILWIIGENDSRPLIFIISR